MPKTGLMRVFHLTSQFESACRLGAAAVLLMCGVVLAQAPGRNRRTNAV